MKVILFDETHMKHMARVHGSLNKPRYHAHQITPAFTKDGRCTVNACVLDQTGEHQRFKHYVNILEWNRGNIIDVTYEDYDHDNWTILVGHTVSLEELVPSSVGLVQANDQI